MTPRTNTNLGMIIEFLLATICLPLIAVETSEIVTATSLEMQLMKSLNASTEDFTEVELMTENCYEVTIT